MTPRPLLIAGVEFDFGGGREFTVPPLSVGALELLQERLNQMPALTVTDPAALRTVVDAAHAALKRNYPEATREEVAELVDLGNIGDVYECIMDVGGMRRRAQQEARAGNASVPPAAAAAGTPSTPA